MFPEKPSTLNFLSIWKCRQKKSFLEFFYLSNFFVLVLSYFHTLYWRINKSTFLFTADSVCSVGNWYSWRYPECRCTYDLNVHIESNFLNLRLSLTRPKSLKLKMLVLTQEEAQSIQNDIRLVQARNTHESETVIQNFLSFSTFFRIFFFRYLIWLFFFTIEYWYYDSNFVTSDYSICQFYNLGVLFSKLIISSMFKKNEHNLILDICMCTCSVVLQRNQGKNYI